MQPIMPEAVQNRLDQFTGRTVYLHLETTSGAYTEGGAGVFFRNAPISFSRALLKGTGPYRAGLQTEHGWVYAEGLTDWEEDGQGRLLLAGHDKEGRLMVAMELSLTPFPTRGEGAVLHPAQPQPADPAVDPRFRQRHLLVVLAHPDDETFACGGTIALHARAGTPVTYVCATRGEMGRNMGKPAFTTREHLREVREQELRAACALLGITDLRMLGVWDKTVEFTDPDGLTDRVSAIMAETQPSLIITFHPEYGGHPDHNAIGAAVMRAVHRLRPEQRPAVYYAMHPAILEKLDPKPPTEAIEITAVAEVKLAAIRAHRSQSQGMMEGIAFGPDALEKMRRDWSKELFWVCTPDAAPVG